jgi:hypothetical protein
VEHLDNATNEITKELTQFSTVHRQKLDGPQILQKFLAFNSSRKFTAAFTRAHHFSLSGAIYFQFVPHPASWRSILILFFQLPLCLPSGFSSSGFPNKHRNQLWPKCCVIYCSTGGRYRNFWALHFNQSHKRTIWYT